MKKLTPTKLLGKKNPFTIGTKMRPKEEEEE